MNKFLLILLIIPTFAQAKFVISGGPELSGNIDDSSLKSSTLPGLHAESEYGRADYPNVTVFGRFIYNQGPARSQYKYTDPDDMNNTEVDDVKTKVSLTRLLAGLRYKVMKHERFSYFAGGGLQFGVLNMNLERSSFYQRALPTDDFEQNEYQNFWGYFGELGGEVRFDGDFALRLAAQMSKASTEKFKILDNKEVDFSLATIALSYVWYIKD